MKTNDEILCEINNILENKKFPRDTEVANRVEAYWEEIHRRRVAIIKKYDDLIAKTTDEKLKKQYQNKKGPEVKKLYKETPIEFGYINGADYDIKITTKEYVYIEDLDNGWWTITTNVEGVLYNLRDKLKGRKLFYKDTEGNIDEILYEDEYTFIGFKVGSRPSNKIFRRQTWEKENVMSKNT